VINVFHYDFGGFSDSAGIAVTAGYEKGSTAITLASTPSGNFLVPGLLIAITENQSNNKFGMVRVGDYYRDGLTDSLYGLQAHPDRVFRYVSRISSVVGNTIHLATPLPLSFSPSLSIRAYPRQGNYRLFEFGIENLTITNSGNPVRMYLADRFWMKDVEISNCPYGDAGLIYLHGCFQPQLERLYIHDVPGWPDTSEGMCIGVYDATSNGLFKDIISNRTACQFYNSGCVANAFLYNYAMDCSRVSGTVPSRRVLMGYGYHRGHSYMNLLEGNIYPGYQPDGYHGSSSHDILLRNSLNGIGTNLDNERWLMNLDRFSYFITAVGNAFGDPSWEPVYYDATPPGPGRNEGAIYRLGYPDGSGGSPYVASVPCSLYTNAGGTYPDPNVAATLLRHGNYDYFNNATVWDSAIVSRTIPASLFYSSRPAFFGSLQWPPIGPDIDGLVTRIPAQARWAAYLSSGRLEDLFR
jgi:hypothetical protein